MKVILFSGNHEEMGKKQGEGFSQVFLELYNQVVVPNLKKNKPFFRTMKRFEKESAESLMKFYMPLYENLSGFTERFGGIAEGSNLIPTRMAILNFYEFQNEIVRSNFSSLSVIVLPEKSYYDVPMLVYIVYDISDFASLFFIRKSQAAGSLRTIELTSAPMVGSFAGFNESGLTVSANFFSEDSYKKISPSSVVQKILEECESFECAFSVLSNFSDAISANFALLKDDRAVLVEVSEKGVEKRYCDKNLMIIDGSMPWMDVESFGEVKKRMYKLSKKRRERFEERAVKKRKLTVEDMVTITRDHGVDFHPSEDTICAHSEFQSTVAAVIMMPTEGKVWAVAGNPCNNVFRQIKFLK